MVFFKKINLVLQIMKQKINYKIYEIQYKKVKKEFLTLININKYKV